jgi:hypothetical protein
MTFRKGDLVRVLASPGALETALAFPHINPVRTGYRPLTQAEIEEWYRSPASKGMTDDGETKLPPSFHWVAVAHKTVVIVIRARCRIQLRGRTYSGMAEVANITTGESFYLERDFLEVLT